MKGGVRKKSFFIFVISNFITIPLICWIIGGVYFIFFGFFLALLIDNFFPTWKYDLTWKDIEISLKNIYRYGRSPCEICFIVGNRRIFIYRDEKQIRRNNGTLDSIIRMAVCIPLKEWKDLLSDADFNEMFDKFGGKAVISKTRRIKSFDIYATKGKHIEDCKGLLNFLFIKAVNGLNPNIFASSTVNSTKNIWIDHNSS